MIGGRLYRSESQYERTDANIFLPKYVNDDSEDQNQENEIKTILSGESKRKNLNDSIQTMLQRLLKKLLEIITFYCGFVLVSSTNPRYLFCSKLTNTPHRVFAATCRTAGYFILYAYIQYGRQVWDVKIVFYLAIAVEIELQIVERRRISNFALWHLHSHVTHVTYTELIFLNLRHKVDIYLALAV